VEKDIVSGIKMEKKYVDAMIADSPYGYKMIVPVFNGATPSYYKSKAIETVRAFMEAYALSYGVALKPEDIYADGNLSVCLDRKIPAERKYRLYIVIIVEDKCSAEPQDYIIEMPVLPTDRHFAEFRQCILNEMEAMIGKPE